MIWECGDCSQPESRQQVVSTVCHHCGMPLCRDHRYVVADNAFGGPIAGRRAVHCKPCRDMYHPKSIGLGGFENG